MKLVLDSNVIIAAFAVRGLCQAVFEYCLESHEVVLCESIIAEVRKNLREKVKVAVPIVTEIEAYLRESAIVENPDSVDSEIFEDESDLPVLGVAHATDSSYIITGDGALLALKKYGNTDIISPREFWDRIRKQSNN
jgi:putative PIN family toxin of toxin-antitoxin system